MLAGSVGRLLDERFFIPGWHCGCVCPIHGYGAAVGRCCSASSGGGYEGGAKLVLRMLVWLTLLVGCLGVIMLVGMGTLMLLALAVSGGLSC